MIIIPSFFLHRFKILIKLFVTNLSKALKQVKNNLILKLETNLAVNLKLTA